MRYEVRLMREAAADLVRLAKSEPKVYTKAKRFLGELAFLWAAQYLCRFAVIMLIYNNNIILL